MIKQIESINDIKDLGSEALLFYIQSISNQITSYSGELKGLKMYSAYCEASKFQPEDTNYAQQDVEFVQKQLTKCIKEISILCEEYLLRTTNKE
jgi:hypothetical protein